MNLDNYISYIEKNILKTVKQVKMYKNKIALIRILWYS